MKVVIIVFKFIISMMKEIDLSIQETFSYLQLILISLILFRIKLVLVYISCLEIIHAKYQKFI